MEAARAQRVNAGVSAREEARRLAQGRARVLVYAVATGTALRQGELKRLRWQDVDRDRQTVHVPPTSAKSRKGQSVPLRDDLAAALAAFRPTGIALSAPVFAGRTFPTQRTLLADLAAAGIARRDESDRVVDFHSLRVSFVSALAAAGVHPRVAQALARHAHVDTTMRCYTDLALLDLRGAVAKTTPGLLARLLARTDAVEPRSASSTCASGGVEPVKEESAQDVKNEPETTLSRKAANGGRRGTRTPDLVRVKHAL